MIRPQEERVPNPRDLFTQPSVRIALVLVPAPLLQYAPQRREDRAPIGYSAERVEGVFCELRLETEFSDGRREWDGS